MSSNSSEKWLRMDVVFGQHNTTTTTTTMRSTSTSTALMSSTTSGEEFLGAPLMSLLGVALVVGIIIIACSLVMSVRFFVRQCKHKKCTKVFVSFLKCACIGDICCGPDGAADNDSQGSPPSIASTTAGDENCDGESENWDPPRYRDALGMQRLDSSTILGIPPPSYDNLIHTTKCKDAGHVNLGFEYPIPERSRQFSQASLNISIISRPEPFGQMVDPDRTVHDSGSTLSYPSSVISFRAEPSTGSETPSHTEERTTTSDNHVTSRDSVTIFETLPSYDDVLAWMTGTDL